MSNFQATRQPDVLDAHSTEFLETSMCRNIKTLFNFDPPATEDEIRASAIQFVRKLSGSAKPSKLNEAVFEKAVDSIADVSRELLESLVTSATPKDRQTEAARARARAQARLGR